MDIKYEPLRLAVVGAYVADCLVNTPTLPTWGRTDEARSIRTSPGGKALNQAVALARLGAKVAAVGAIGSDPLGRDILDKLAREQVDSTGIQVREKAATPVCVCLIGDRGNTSFIWSIADESAVTIDTVQHARCAIQDADAVLITFEIPVPAIREAIRVAHDYGTRVVVQPAPPLGTAVDLDSLPWNHVDLVVPNELEARALLAKDGQHDTRPARELARAVADAFDIPQVVVTLGPAGCVAHLEGSTREHRATDVAEVVDATGGSDAFTATLAFHLTAGTPGGDAVEAALDAAAWAISRTGGHESMPTAGRRQHL